MKLINNKTTQEEFQETCKKLGLVQCEIDNNTISEINEKIKAYNKLSKKQREILEHILNFNTLFYCWWDSVYYIRVKGERKTVNIRTADKIIPFLGKRKYEQETETEYYISKEEEEKEWRRYH